MTEPREALLHDLAAKVNQLTEKNHSVMVLGDMNDDADKSKRLQEFLEDTSMYDAIKNNPLVQAQQHMTEEASVLI